MNMRLAEMPTGPAKELDARNGLLPELRTCRCCFGEFPITQFRYESRADGRRHHICRKCVSRQAQQRRERLRHKVVFEHISACHNKRQNADVLAFAVRDMVQALGGTRQFARKWHAAVDWAQRQGRSASVLRAYLLIAEMYLAHQQLLPSSGELTDEELMAGKRAAMCRAIEQAPDLAAQVLASMGWTVVAPNTYNDDDTAGGAVVFHTSPQDVPS